MPPLARKVLAEQRAFFELGAFGAALPWFSFLPRGDGHPVLVLPGLAATDGSTIPLRGVLRALGYDAHGWSLGRNTGPDEETVRGMVERVEELWGASGRRPVSLIGWSLGGVYARGLARRHPDRVRQVITLGSPFRPIEAERGDDTPPVPTTAVFSRTDAVVPWLAAIEQPGPARESVEVRGSHLGLGHNPAVVVVVADRLAQAPGADAWQPFRPPRVLQHWFP